MFSRILVKLVDEAIVPALVLLSARVITALVLTKIHNMTFSFTASGFVYGSHDEFLFLNSYSTLAMVCVITVGLLYVLMKSHFFHSTHIKPHTSARLFSLNLSGFIQTSFELYSQGAIWLSYSYLLLFSTGIMLYFELIYTWIFYVSFVLTLISTYLFVIDVEKELQIKREPSPVNQEAVLRFSDEEVE